MFLRKCVLSILHIARHGLEREKKQCADILYWYWNLKIMFSVNLGTIFFLCTEVLILTKLDIHALRVN